MITENLACDSNEILIHGEQTVPGSVGGSYPADRLHFMGTKKVIPLHSSSVNNGQNECVFRHICATSVIMCSSMFRMFRKKATGEFVKRFLNKCLDFNKWIK